MSRSSNRSSRWPWGPLLIAVSFAVGCGQSPAPASDSGAAASATAAAPDRPSASITQAASEAIREIVVVVDAWAPAETLQYLASISDTQPEIAKRFETLGAFSQRRFGQAYYAQVLADLNPELSGNASSGGARAIEIPMGATLMVPVFDAPEAYRRVIVPAGGSAFDSALSFYPKVGEQTLREIANASKLKRIELDDLRAEAVLTFPRPSSIRVVRLPAGADAEQVLAQVRSQPGVGLATLNGRAGALIDPVAIDANTVASLGGKYETAQLTDTWFAQAIGADRIIAEDLVLSQRVVVAVLDSGLDFSHPWFANNLWVNPAAPSPDDVSTKGTNGYDFVRRRDDPGDTHESSHGTHVSGIASGRSLASLPVFKAAALDKFIKVMVLRVADEYGTINIESIMSALEYAAANGARVVSASWTTIDSSPLRDYLKRYASLLTVVAAGNGEAQNRNGRAVDVGYNIDDKPTFPAGFGLSNTIVVGAYDPDLAPAFFSNFGRKNVHVFAPGVGIRSAVRGMKEGEEAIAARNGTSQATPLVALAASIMLAKDGSLSTRAIRDRILYTGDYDGTTDKSAFGRLNLLRAISVDTDLIELSGRVFLRGELLMPTVSYAKDAASCGAAGTIDVVANRLGRIVVKQTGTSSLALLPGELRPGWVCNPTLTIRTSAGVVTRPLSDVKDITWRGSYGRR